MKDAIEEPAPGKTPIKKPVIEPLKKAKRQAFSSCQLGNRLRNPRGTGRGFASTPASMLASTSAIAKTPMATTMKSMPPSREAWPKVKRDCAVNRSVPMLVSHRPTSNDSNPLTSEAPESRTTKARPSAIRAKYSGELNDNAKEAIGGAAKVS